MGARIQLHSKHGLKDQWLQIGHLLQPETILHGSLTGVSGSEKGTAVEPPERKTSK